jgi:hypothetical protein
VNKRKSSTVAVFQAILLMTQLLLSHPQEATVPVPLTKQPRSSLDLRNVHHGVGLIDVQINEFKAIPEIGIQPMF